MNTECCICLNNLDMEDNELWTCTICNIEVHRKCKAAWDAIDSGKKTCPHCRNEELEIVILEPHRETDINELREQDIVYSSDAICCCSENMCLYGKLIIIIIGGLFSGFIMAGILLIIIQEFQYTQIYNYTSFR